ncbi:Thymidylate synthase [Seminavis robusta]|uniref:Thymidylate synthase n=1 Tax=Seminavis robusta TaxID=568900 RepID=A0A9N8ES94_9STRA|nr:Thymidylate synthase [Seminavis robusta]|eukprot:Sro1634_g287440.1 Thymidylate synthase (527) ;mRNA; r:3328-4908
MKFKQQEKKRPNDASGIDYLGPRPSSLRRTQETTITPGRPRALVSFSPCCNLLPSSTPLQSQTPMSQLTQPLLSPVDLTAGLDEHENQVEPLIALLEDGRNPPKEQSIEIREDTVAIGSDDTRCRIFIRSKHRRVSRVHCELSFFDGRCSLSAKSKCWVLSYNNNQWTPIKAGRGFPISHRSRLRLVRPGYKQEDAKDGGVEYIVHLMATIPGGNPGSHSFDLQYLHLLEQIELHGVLQTANKKGPNRALPKTFPFDIDLHDPTGQDRNLLPITSLRSLYGGRPALVEALWYLRGEDHIAYLQDNNCPFWDRQATKKDDVDNWLGLNYGLLTNFPQPNGQGTYNQLEEEAIKPLCKHGSSSRNMTCSLFKPGEETVQRACTSSIQFSVSTNNNIESLNLTINQRSSDTIVGLPHDVVVWSIILHLVWREVWIRSQRKLHAGTLSFAIVQNCAHVYQINDGALHEILQRKPKPECQPYLVIDDDKSGIFDLAAAKKPPVSLRIAKYAHYHPSIRLQVAEDKKGYQQK